MRLRPFGAGPKALARRKRTVAALENAIQIARDGTHTPVEDDLTVKVQLGGIREVASPSCARSLEYILRCHHTICPL